jgi:hypothetical protein
MEDIKEVASMLVSCTEIMGKSAEYMVREFSFDEIKGDYLTKETWELLGFASGLLKD